MKLSTMLLLKNANIDYSDYIHLDGDMLRKYQLALLEITDDIVEVCEQEHITYQLSGGSCLGAVRHKGFIPWDDDMDINMLGDHFERFIKTFQKKYGDKYWIHTCHTKDYGLLVSRIRLKIVLCEFIKILTIQRLVFLLIFFDLRIHRIIPSCVNYMAFFAWEWDFFFLVESIIKIAILCVS